MDQLFLPPPLTQPLVPAEEIMKLEKLVGRLSPLQKMLIGTDGSVTNLLEVVTGGPVEIVTLEQRIIAADEAVAKELAVNPGDDINYRVVLLKKAGCREALIYAISHTLRWRRPSEMI